MAAGLKDRIQARAPELFDALYKNYRPELDDRITILDLGYEALKVNVYRGNFVPKRDLEAYNAIYEILQDVVRKALAKRTYVTLEDERLKDYFSKSAKPYPVLIDSPGNFFIVGKNFDAIRNFVSNNISANPRLKATRFGESRRYRARLNKQGVPTGDYEVTTRSKVDIGHIPSPDNINLTSPLEEKIQEVLRVAATLGNTNAATSAKLALDKLYDIQANLSYDFRNTTPEAIAQARSVLGEAYVVVTLHTEKKNNTFSRKELEIFNKLVNDIATSLGIDTIPGSNTIREDIVEGLLNIIKTGKAKLKQHSKITAKVSKNIGKKAKVKAAKLTPIKSFQEDVSQPSPVQLQSLLNQYLVQVVKQNMGTGTRRDVLNLRSGRFAESVNVDRISISRQGMITTFYSYMKNPYATFSSGGAQQFPRSRDPKLLITKSIREIAAKLTTARLRAVAT
jgi:hypothetical protein